ncbi:MAG: hypothetical protein VX610_03875 [SAR324 cluster bacterium]|nr:hypothetical protein [SAR324 cluster bacterium]
MARALKLNLPSQTEIRQEGNPEPTRSVPVVVGRAQMEFFIPELQLDGVPLEEGSPRVQQVVHKINQYIENIADDYFLLGLHLIALHRLLKDSGLTTDQVKLWYTENVNMPYSSAMQCRKVAEVYEDQPGLIGRYTASGAYLLTTCADHEEREAIWQQAKGDKDAPSVRDLRVALREFKEQQLLPGMEEDADVAVAVSVPQYRMGTQQIHESLQHLSRYCEQLSISTDESEQLEMRQALLEAVQRLLEQMQEVS